MRKSYRALGLLLFQINALTIWTYLFRKYYIIYHHLKVYYLVSLLFLLVSLILSSNDHKNLSVMGCATGVSLLLAVPLAFYPSIVNNPDVIKMLQLTSLIIRRNFELARKVDYSAFPGFSYLFGVASTIVKAKLDIKFASILYVFLAIIFLLLILSLGKNSKWISMYLLIIFSEGFVYSFNYLSPQLLGQILLVTGLVILIKSKRGEAGKYFILLLLSYAGILITHPESTLMLLLAFVCYSLGNVLVNKTARAMTNILAQILTFFVMLVTYAIFFIRTYGPAYILKAPLTCPIYSPLYIYQRFLNLFNSKGSKVVTSSSIKPEIIHTLDKVNILYNAVLLIFVIFLLIKYRKKFFIYGTLLFSFFVSSGVFLIVFNQYSFGEFIGRSAFGASLVVGILTTRYLKDKENMRMMKSAAIISLAVLLLFSFPARVTPQEGNVHAENYYPPIEFIHAHKFSEISSGNTYYFLYPNIGTSLHRAKYVILPIGQKTYITGASSRRGWDVNTTMYNIMRKEKYDGEIYSNSLSVVLWRG